MHYWQIWVSNFQFVKNFMKLGIFIKFSVINRSMKRYIVSFKGINSWSCSVTQKVHQRGIHYCESRKTVNTRNIYGMLCYCVARNKPIRHKITKPQTTMVIILVCDFEVACVSWTLRLASTQSTFLKFFRCSQFSEFHSNSTNVGNLTLWVPSAVWWPSLLNSIWWKMI